MIIIDKEPKGITMHNYKRKKKKEIIVKAVRWKQKILTIIDEKKQNNNKEFFFPLEKRDLPSSVLRSIKTNLKKCTQCKKCTAIKFQFLSRIQPMRFHYCV